MRIALETRALAARGGGVRRYVEKLREELSVRPGIELSELRLQNPLFLTPWLQWSVPRQLQKLQPDMVHFTKADVPRKKVAPTVVTIYDVIPLLFHEGQKTLQRWYWPGALQRAATFSDAILTISKASKQDIVEQLNVAPEKITVTLLGVDATSFRPLTNLVSPSLSFVRRGEKQPYILFVGTLEPRKNVPLLIRAFSRITKDVPHKLVIAGKRDNDYAAVVAAIKASELGERIELKDFVVPAELPALYSGTDLFVWPSVYEGWGLPPMEALASGVPTIVSNGGSLPEVVGEAGVTVPFAEMDVTKRRADVAFEAHLAQTMLAVLTDSAWQARLRVAGPQQAAKFTWRSMAEKTVAVYNKVAV